MLTRHLSVVGGDRPLSTLQEWWQAISRRRAEELSIDTGPLVELRGAETHFGFLRLADLSFEPALPLAAIPQEAAFKNVSSPIAATLRRAMYRGDDMTTVAQWAEKIHRFLEVRMPNLRALAVEKAGNLAEARALFLQLGAFMVDYYFAAGDVRFLNTGLKVRDLRWVTEPAMARALRGSGPRFRDALFQVRLHLLTEFAISRFA